MIKKSFLLGAIASVIAINSVMADTTVTSKTYVDNHDALKQDKITAGTTGNVVTYNGTQNGQAQFSERGVCDTTAEENDDCDSNYLVTRDLLGEQINDLGDQIEQATDLPETTVTYKTCYQEVNGDCILWNLSDRDVYGKCHNDNDCAWLDCTNNPNKPYYGCLDSGRCACGGGK